LRRAPPRRTPGVPLSPSTANARAMSAPADRVSRDQADLAYIRHSGVYPTSCRAGPTAPDIQCRSKFPSCPGQKPDRDTVAQLPEPSGRRAGDERVPFGGQVGASDVLAPRLIEGSSMGPPGVTDRGSPLSRRGASRDRPFDASGRRAPCPVPAPRAVGHADDRAPRRRREEAVRS
jgi:hypothetical protein